MLERDLGPGEEIWSADGGLSKLVIKSMANASTKERPKMMWKEYEQQQKYERDIQILSRLIGTTICRIRGEWDASRQLYATFYETMKIGRIVMEINPIPIVRMEFDCPSSPIPPATFSSIDDFEGLIGKVGQYGSIKEMLISEDFSFGKL